MIKYTAQTLQSLENLFKQIGYLVRYEKGNFQSGYCVVKARKVVVVSRFFTTDARIQCLIDILLDINPDEQTLTAEQNKLLQECRLLRQPSPPQT